METEESKIIEEIKKGDTNKFSYFVNEYGYRIFRVVNHIVSSKEDAEELTQDVFVKAFRNINKYRGEAGFATWIYKIAYTTSISFVRKKRQEVNFINEEMIESISDSEVEERFNYYEEENKIELISKAIGILNADEKFIVSMFYYENKSMDDISKVLDISVANVKVRLFRIRKKMYATIKNNVYE